MSVQDIYNKLRTAPEFHPASAELFDDFTIEAGDVISLQSDGENYALPVFAQRTVWNGSAMVTVQSQGDKERKPLPALQRKEYGRGRGYYQQERDIQETKDNFKRFDKFIEDTDERFSRLMTESEWDEAADQSVVTMWSQVTQTAEAITAEILRAKGAEQTLSTSITANAEGIRTLVEKTAIGELGANETLYSKIVQNAESISLKVSKGDIASTINQTAQSVLIQAGKIDLDGYVTAAQLDVVTGTIEDLTAGRAAATSMYIETLKTDLVQFKTGSSSYSQLNVGTMTVYPASTGVTARTYNVIVPGATTSLNMNHYHKITATTGTGDDAGKIFLTLEDTQGMEGNANFNMADTKFFQDEVSAAYERGKQEGGAAPTIVSVVRDQTKNTTYASAIYTVPVIVTFSDGTTQDSTVNISISTGSYNADTKRYPINVAGNTDRSLDASAAFNAGANSKAFSSANVRGVNSTMYDSLDYSVLTVGGSKSSGYYSLAVNYKDGTTTFRKFTTV